MKNRNLLVGIAYNAYDPVAGRNGERVSEECVEMTAKEVLAACRNFPLPRHRRITFGYVLLAGVNDEPAMAKELTRQSIVNSK